ncbi:WD40/YVTN/BNR-like repeat-containing protein [Paenibacillus sp. KR2-11]|uniref:WD40/YVTN/BNR-like repeat-containing protein n=1 Tax=Paenibacillus sp. KR2-11 TaxID=3385500 RepID=UPI0038FD3C57
MTLPIVLTLGGCGQTPGPQPAGAAGANPAKTETAPAVSTDAKSPAAPADSGESKTIQARLTGFHAVDERTAYAWGLSAGGQFRLYRTADGGGTWHESASPTSAQQKGDPGPEAIQAADSTHLVYVPAGHTLPASVSVSADGGATWKEGMLPEGVAGGEAVFTDKAHGYLMNQPDAAMGSSRKVICETTDGGVTWSVVMDNQAMEQKPDQAQGLLPLQGFANRGMAFRDTDNGWVPLESRTPGKVTLYRTKDKARTWQELSLDVSSRDDQGQPQITGAPEFFGGEAQSGWMPYEYRHGDVVSLGAYFTEDGGETWKLTSFGKEADVMAKLSSTGLTFLSGREGWMWNGAHLLHTADGGKAWTPLAGNTVFQDTLKSYPYLISLEFVTPKTGWALVRSEKGDASRLLRTEDGGATWKVM